MKVPEKRSREDVIKGYLDTAQAYDDHADKIEAGHGKTKSAEANRKIAQKHRDDAARIEQRP